LVDDKELIVDKVVLINKDPYSLVEFTCTEWVSLEATNTPCVNERGSTGRTINMKDVDGVILKHWVTFRVCAVISKGERIHRCTITAGSKFSGK
jgi:hypothetical protein